MSHTTGLSLAIFAVLGSATFANAQTAPMPAMPVMPMAPTAGMPTPGMPNPGAPGPGGPGAMPMMDMSKMMQGGGGQMPPMMQMMQMMRGGQMMPGMMQFDHIEGRIAYIKAELAITDSQAPQWNAFAEILRTNATSMREGMAKMMQAGMPVAAPARADAMVQMMTVHLDDMKSMVTAGKALYAVMTDAQKKLADDMMRGPMGRM